jgi:hypothetical protein
MKALPSILRHSPFSKRESILGIALEEFIEKNLGDEGI